ncbi:MAG: DNA methyltransferase, partial [Bernardetiaceae bacterium]|nr:DNA methyltransferase [Bernardetiaceae bacterium]
SLKSVRYEKMPNVAPNYFFVPKDFDAQKGYDKGFKINELFVVNGVGMTTAHDEFVIQENKAKLLDFYKKFQFSPRDADFLHKEFKVRKKTGWDILQGYDNIKNETDLSKYIEPISYRPFDNRFIFYEDKLVWRTVKKVMQNFINGENLGLTLCKQFKTGDSYAHVFISNKIIESSFVSNRTSEITSIFPLYLYPEHIEQQKTNKKHLLDDLQLLELRKEELLTLIEGAEPAFRTVQKMYENIENPDAEIKELYSAQKENLQKLKNELKNVLDKLKKDNQKATSISELFIQQEKKPNLKKEIVEKIAAGLGLSFTPEKENKENTFAPIDILDYIYAVLHSPSYREKYKEFLKIDFPRVPYPKDATTFWKLVQVGGELRQIHLLETPKVEQFITQYPVSGDNAVDKPKYQKGRVYINETQYFDNVPQVAWEFYIGGYQPAQKWLKDRKGRKLEFEEVLHYQKIIVALAETAQLIQAIDKILIGS